MGRKVGRTDGGGDIGALAEPCGAGIRQRPNAVPGPRRHSVSTTHDDRARPHWRSPAGHDASGPPAQRLAG